MLADIPETSIQTGGGRRWDGQKVELQVSMSLWKLWPADEYRKKKKKGAQDSTKNYRNSEAQLYL